jgi:hypothetical protein
MVLPIQRTNATGCQLVDRDRIAKTAHPRLSSRSQKSHFAIVWLAAGLVFVLQPRKQRAFLAVIFQQIQIREWQSQRNAGRFQEGTSVD